MWKWGHSSQDRTKKLLHTKIDRGSPSSVLSTLTGFPGILAQESQHVLSGDARDWNVGLSACQLPAPPFPSGPYASSLVFPQICHIVVYKCCVILKKLASRFIRHLQMSHSIFMLLLHPNFSLLYVFGTCRNSTTRSPLHFSKTWSSTTRRECLTSLTTASKTILEDQRLW